MKGLKEKSINLTYRKFQNVLYFHSDKSLNLKCYLPIPILTVNDRIAIQNLENESRGTLYLK